MSYAIPANIKYEERLVGPYTIKQSIYLATGLGLGWWTYANSGIVEPLKSILAISLGFIGLLFAQFNLDVWLMNYFNFIRSDKKSSWISESARKLMNIKDIRADSVFLKDGRVLGVLRITPINFGVLSPQDQDTVIYGFLEFLNSLNYPVQIVMRSVNLDLNEYLAHLKRRIVKRDDRIALAYYQHFAEYMRSYIESNNINDRHFYLVIPAKNQKTEKNTIDYLETQCEEIKARFSMSGIVSERMNNQELINYYGSYFTESFEIYEKFISPITIYRRMWKSAPKPMDVAQKDMLKMKGAQDASAQPDAPKPKKGGGQ